MSRQTVESKLLKIAKKRCGLSIQEIAGRVGVHQTTIYRALRGIRAALSVRRRIELVVDAPIDSTPEEFAQRKAILAFIGFNPYAFTLAELTVELQKRGIYQGPPLELWEAAEGVIAYHWVSNLPDDPRQPHHTWRRKSPAATVPLAEALPIPPESALSALSGESTPAQPKSDFLPPAVPALDALRRPSRIAPARQTPRSAPESHPVTPAQEKTDDEKPAVFGDGSPLGTAKF